MPEYWGKQIFTKQKTERKEERLNDGNNNGQLRITKATSGSACKAAWAKRKRDRKLVITKASYAFQTPPRVAHASRLGQKKERLKVGNNNGQLCIATPPRVAHAKPPGPISLHTLWCKKHYQNLKLG